MRNTRQATALQTMLQTLPALGRVILSIRRHDRNLADQTRRASTSTCLNLAEADGSDPGTARARLHSALGSLRETRTALQVAQAFGYLSPETVAPLDNQLDSVAAMTFRRLHPKR
jgi:four helix bundle protein